jgi:hypothetical protein
VPIRKPLLGRLSPPSPFRREKISHLRVPNGAIPAESPFIDKIDIPKISTVLKLLQTISATQFTSDEI